MAGEEKQIVVEETTAVPGKMEFRLISPTESNFLKHIEWNKEELLAAVRSKVALYEGIVYTEETVKTAKNDRAELNNLVKAKRLPEQAAEAEKPAEKAVEKAVEEPVKKSRARKPKTENATQEKPAAKRTRTKKTEKKEA